MEFGERESRVRRGGDLKDIADDMQYFDQQ